MSNKILPYHTIPSCPLDPIPTWLLKQCIPELLPIITAILNASLKTESVPALLKYAIIRSHMKKSSLDTEELKKIQTSLQPSLYV